MKGKLSAESIELLEALKAAAQKAGEDNGNRQQPDKRVYFNLLSGISTCRRLPGIPENMGYEEVYKCDGGKNVKAAKKALNDMYGVTDADTLEEVKMRYNCDRDFRDFFSFWKNHPVFDIEQLNPGGKMAFTACMDFAGQLYKYTGSKGFLAWDLNEQVGLCRKAFACGVLSEDEFYGQIDSYIHRASAFFDNWGEYALSCVCGAVYWMYRSSDFSMEEAEKFLRLNQGLVLELLKEEGAWGRYGWLCLQDKKFAMSPSEMLELVPDDYQGAMGCFISDRITVDGMKIGYMYREEPDEGMPDSGWRFLAGDEDDDYVNDISKVGIYHLNTACNYDEDIIPFLTREPYVAFGRNEDGDFVQEG